MEEKSLDLRSQYQDILVVILDPIMLFFGCYASMIAPKRRMHLWDCSRLVAIWS